MAGQSGRLDDVSSPIDRVWFEITRRSTSRGRSAVARYGVAIGVATLALLAHVALNGIMQPTEIYALYFPAIIVATRYGGAGAGVLSTLICGITTKLLWIPPAYSLMFSDFRDAIGLLVFHAVALVVIGIVKAERHSAANVRVTADELRKQADRWRITLASIGDAVIVMDEKGRIIALNAVAETLTGKAQTEAIGKLLREVFTTYDPENRQPLLDPAERALKETNTKPSKPVLLKKSDGTERYIEENVTPIRGQDKRTIGIVLVFRDVTEREKTDLALKEAERRFRNMADTAPVLIWMSGTDKLFSYFNRPWLQFTGRTIDQELGKGWTDSVHPEDYERWFESYASAFDNREELKIEFRLLRHDGEYRWVFANGVPRYTDDGSFAGYIGTCLDIHERKQAEISEKVAREDAERANRMKDEFLATVSHELRTPLTPILGWAAMLKAGRLNKQQSLHGVEVIEKSARVQSALIEDLLDVSRIITGKLRLDRKPINLVQAVEAAMDSVRPTADAKKIKLELVMEKPARPILGDKNRLQQVFWNLLTNAIKFTPHNGRVEILIEPDGELVAVSVKDTGEGIDPEFLPHMFERFRQADSSSTRKFGGLGLGLSIVRHLVDAHGGTVWAQSEGKGLGATFTVSLPIADSAVLTAESRAVKAVSADSHGRPPQLQGIRILVVDDEPETREFISFVLTQWGAEVTAAESVPAAFESMKHFHPDILVSDIGMPEEDGFSLIRKLRDQDINIPAIALTAFARTEDVEKTLREGFQKHIAKPVEPEDLVASVADLANKSEADIVNY
jgi:PAS domain S-box-containing protein